jgi:hypothetical protein
MAIGTDFEIQNDRDIRYVGLAHGGTGPGITPSTHFTNG